MATKSWVHYLIPRDEQEEHAFRDELERQSVAGLRLGGAVLTVFTICAWFIGVTVPLAQTVNAAEATSSLIFFGLGLGAIGISFWRSSKAWARTLALSLGYIVGTLDIGVALFWPGATHSVQGAHSHFVINFAFILLVLLAAFPLKPVHIIGLGALLFASYLGMVVGSGRGDELTGMDAVHVIMALLLLFVCTALTAHVYKQRAATFRARRWAEESFELLRGASKAHGLSERRLAGTTGGGAQPRTQYPPGSDDHGGVLEIESEEAKGTTARVVLPIAAKPEGGHAPS